MTEEATGQANSVASPDHRVAVFGKIADPHVLGVLLTRVLNMRPMDAVIAARETPRVLPALMTPAQAKQLESMIRELGIEAFGVPAAELPDVADPEQIHHAASRPDGLQTYDLKGEPAEVLPWSDCGVIAIGEIPGAAGPRLVAQGPATFIAAGPHLAAGRKDLSTHRELELWLLTRSAAKAYCLRHDRFNYESLGDTKTDSATANFEKFARGLAHHAAGVRQSPSTHAYLAKEHSKYEFRSSPDLAQHALLYWVMDRSVRQGTQAPSPGGLASPGSPETT